MAGDVPTVEVWCDLGSGPGLTVEVPADKVRADLGDAPAPVDDDTD